MKKLYAYLDKLDIIRDIPLLLIRVVLAYGFWSPGMKKLENFDSIVGWFSSLGIPFPTLNAFLATATELVGAILLLLGLFTRLISIPLIIVMFVAIFTVHLVNGFEASNNGYEIPLYYILMLLTLVGFGSGKLSLDYILQKK